MVTTDDIWNLLEDVKDPEVPVLSVVDLGVIRHVDLENGNCIVTITPTYSGCPAMRVIEEDIIEVLKQNHIPSVEVKTVLSPSWTTDWISIKGREKLREYGIAPPQNEPDKSVLFGQKVVVPCPRCGSENTKMISQFGSTACKAHYQCMNCLEPFDYFKCLR